MRLAIILDKTENINIRNGDMTRRYGYTVANLWRMLFHAHYRDLVYLNICDHEPHTIRFPIFENVTEMYNGTCIGAGNASLNEAFRLMANWFKRHGKPIADTIIVVSTSKGFETIDHTALNYVKVGDAIPRIIFLQCDPTPANLMESIHDTVTVVETAAFDLRSREIATPDPYLTQIYDLIYSSRLQSIGMPQSSTIHDRCI